MATEMMNNDEGVKIEVTSNGTVLLLQLAFSIINKYICFEEESLKMG